MRRGMRHAHSLGNKDPIFHKIFPTLLDNMKESYPELDRAKELITKTLLNEETKFKQTIDNGLKILEEEIINTSNNVFDGNVAFKLYDTYGFPLDLTQDYLKSKLIEVDVKSFDKKMTEQKNRARKNWKGTGDISDSNIMFEITKGLDATEFVGYEKNKTDSIVKKIINIDKSVDIIKKGNKAIILLNKTCFYGESGGQIGDQGFLSNNNFKFKVYDTSKVFGNFYLHHGEVIEGECRIDDQITLSIDLEKRNLVSSNHSSTHLLHAALRLILGKHVNQKGSLVNDEKLRFDFSHNEPLSLNDMHLVESMVNKIVAKNYKVETQILEHKKAIDSGAMALFGEKYGDEVRVVSMILNEDDIFSRELCGGTHILNTGDIKKFRIINQSSVASGVRRVEAITGDEVDRYNFLEIKKKSEYKIKVELQIFELINLIKKMQPDNKIVKNDYDNLDDRLKNLKSAYNDIITNKDIEKSNENITFEYIGHYKFVFLISENYPIKKMKSFVDDQKIKNIDKCIVVLISTSQDKVSIIIGLTNDLIDTFDATCLVKIASLIVGGKGGGGRKDLAQAGGNNPSKAKDVYLELKKEIFKLI